MLPVNSKQKFELTLIFILNYLLSFFFFEIVLIINTVRKTKEKPKIAPTKSRRISEVELTRSEKL